MTTPTSERVFSGVQPSGLPHLGNYLGAFRNWIALQERGDAIYCIVDYHALTSTHDSEAIRRNTHDMAIVRPGGGSPFALVVLTRLTGVATDEGNARIAGVAREAWVRRQVNSR